MSDVWGARYKLRWEQLEQWVEGLTGDEPRQQAVLEERTVRLLAAVLMLVRQHHTNKRGQCRFCAARWFWRFWQRRRCTVHGALDHAMGQSLDVVWWKVLDGLGRDVSLGDVREWMDKRRCERRWVRPADGGPAAVDH